MNNVPILFNRGILDKYLAAFACEHIPDYTQKRAEMLKWKTSIENSDLRKTKETSVQGKFLESVFVMDKTPVFPCPEFFCRAPVPSMLTLLFTLTD